MNNQVPDGWRPSKIGEFAKEVKAKNSDQRPIPVLSVTKYKGFVLSLDYFKKQVFSRDTNTYKVVKKGQFAYATIHLDEGSLGLLSEVPEGQVSPMYTVFKTGKDIDKTYLFNLLKSDEFMNIYPALGQGSIDRRASIPFKVLADVDFSCPPLPEQQKIAAILSSVDDVIKITRAQIDKLKDLKTGMMQELLTKGIGHTAFKDSPVGRIPEGWEVVLLDDVATRGSGHTPSKLKAEYWNGGVDWVSLSDTNKLDRLYISATAKNISEKGVENSSAVIHPPGIVVLSRDAGIGKSAITTKEMAVSQHFIVWHCSDRLDNHFLYYVMQFLKPLFENIAMGSTIKTIGLSFFKKLTVPLPSLDEQRKIAGSLKAIDQRIFATEQKVAQNCKIKKALMQDLLTGKVRVNVDNKENAVA